MGRLLYTSNSPSHEEIKQVIGLASHTFIPNLHFSPDALHGVECCIDWYGTIPISGIGRRGIWRFRYQRGSLLSAYKIYTFKLDHSGI